MRALPLIPPDICTCSFDKPEIVVPFLLVILNFWFALARKDSMNVNWVAGRFRVRGLTAVGLARLLDGSDVVAAAGS